MNKLENLSNEMLGDVLSLEVENYEVISTSKITHIRIWKKDAKWFEYSSYDIHHLAYLFEEWAVENGCHQIQSGIYNTTDQGLTYICLLDVDGKVRDFWGNSKYDAIFKACETLYKEKECI